MSEESYGSFDAEEYVRKKFISPGKTKKAFSTFLLECLASFYKTLPADSSLKILDYGCGPSLAYSISAASRATEIVLADYNKANRDYLQKWLEEDVSAYDWMPYFRYVVKTLEGGTEEGAEKRKHDLRRKVKGVVQCDVLKDDFIDEQYRGLYDVVMSLLCLEAAFKDLDGYKSGVVKLSSLIKEGGHLVLFSTRRENSDVGFYTSNGIIYYDIALKRDFIVRTLEEAGFVVDTEEYLPIPLSPEGNAEGMLFIAAHKVHASSQ